MDERLDKMRMELRRGVLVLAVLAALREEQYGYSLRKRLLKAGIDIEEGTLYPLVRRLEGSGWLASRWSTEEGRNKRYYKISAEGLAVLNELKGDWLTMTHSLGELLKETP